MWNTECSEDASRESIALGRLTCRVGEVETCWMRGRPHHLVQPGDVFVKKALNVHMLEPQLRQVHRASISVDVVVEKELNARKLQHQLQPTRRASVSV